MRSLYKLEEDSARCPAPPPQTVQVPPGVWASLIVAPSPQIRGTLKSWTKLWCVLKPGVLLIYKTPKVGQWVGTVLLHCCELIERPSKKDGFCFKLFHPLDQSVWAVKVQWGRGRNGAWGDAPWETGTGGRPGGESRGSEWAHHQPAAGSHGGALWVAGDQMWSLVLQGERSVGLRNGAV